MSGEYISREAILGYLNDIWLTATPTDSTPAEDRQLAICRCMGLQDAMDAVKEFPAADVVKVRHAHWCVTDAYPHNVYCSDCFKNFAQEHWEIWKDGSLPRDYCPNCGAVMDGEPEDAPTGPYDLLYEEGGPDA